MSPYVMFSKAKMYFCIVTLMLITATAADNDVIELICPKDPDDPNIDPVFDSYCSCDVKTIGLSRLLQVKCDFKNEKKVLLTEKIYDMGNVGFSSAYIRLSYAKGVTVTATFMRQWQQALSSALDLWHCGDVSLASSPRIYKRAGYKTFVGIGIINCQLSNIPPMLIRDHHRGALRIKQATVDVIHPGFIHNIDEIRYLVFEDCVINRITGPASSSGSLTLSHKELHTWNGLLMSNVTIDTITQKAFNLTHLVDVETVSISNSQFGQVDSESFTVSGDIFLNISNNVFESLASNAFQAGTLNQLEFSNNRVESWSPGALSGLQCPSDSRDLSNNIIVSSASNPILLFHSSCGNPELQVEHQDASISDRVVKGDDGGSGGSTAGLVVVSLLLLCLGAAVAGFAWWWRRNRTDPWRSHNRDIPLCEDQDQPDTVGPPVCHMNNKPVPTVQLAR